MNTTFSILMAAAIIFFTCLSAEATICGNNSKAATNTDIYEYRIVAKEVPWAVHLTLG